MDTTKTYPALAFENKDKAGLYIGLLDAWCQDPDEAILYVNKDGSKPDKKKAKEFFLIREKCHKRKTETSNRVNGFKYAT
ncbi:TPA: hypothetical protein SGV36_000431 [Staphylococcus aureus]|nr:hypothetical protein [Staphylococcus aureus]HDA6933370.1 hypothetical protein [Staphylococcus aureus]HEG9845354.1 hypothetical protein [Staphylococcus aureus]HEH3378481.1 hypothetical protein [Staphylococcus aureus]